MSDGSFYPPLEQPLNHAEALEAVLMALGKLGFEAVDLDITNYSVKLSVRKARPDFDYATLASTPGDPNKKKSPSKAMIGDLRNKISDHGTRNV